MEDVIGQDVIGQVEAALENAKETLEFWCEILQAVEELLDVYHPDWLRAIREVNYREARCEAIQKDLSNARNGVETEVAWIRAVYGDDIPF